jgi:hypothetical protein
MAVVAFVCSWPGVAADLHGISGPSTAWYCRKNSEGIE